MSAWLNLTARALRAAPVPDRLRSAVWRRIGRGREGQPYVYPVRWRGVSGVHGGVCGYSDQALLADVEAYEPGSVAVVERLLRGRPRPVVVDVGAHTGAWLFLVKAIAPGAVVHAFEPFPALAAFLDVLVDRNGWNDVTITSSLVGAEPGEGELHFAAGAADCASTVSDFQPTYTERLRVSRVSLDDYAASHGITEISLIKIDVEGGELEVLEGARRTLERLRPPLLLELLFAANPSHARRQQDAVARLQREGYVFFQIQPDGRLVKQDIVRPDERYRALNYLVTTTPDAASAGS